MSNPEKKIDFLHDLIDAHTHIRLWKDSLKQQLQDPNWKLSEEDDMAIFYYIFHQTSPMPDEYRLQIEEASQKLIDNYYSFLNNSSIASGHIEIANPVVLILPYLEALAEKLAENDPNYHSVPDLAMLSSYSASQLCALIKAGNVSGIRSGINWLGNINSLNECQQKHVTGDGKNGAPRKPRNK